MKIYSWNVNGFRAVTNKGNWEWLETHQPDVLCLQETKAREDQIEDAFLINNGYRCFWNSGLRAGYSGTAIYTRSLPVEAHFGIFSDGEDPEGRVTRLIFSDLDIYSVYFPNGQRGLERLSYKLDFYAQFLTVLREKIAAGRKIILCGDFNTAHQEIDLANPRENEQNSGFLPIERDAFHTFLEAGFIDIFRHTYPEQVAYTWWTYRFNARSRNIGWRIDYFLVTENLIKRVVKTDIHAEIQGSDHCPVSLVIN